MITDKILFIDSSQRQNLNEHSNNFNVLINEIKNITKIKLENFYLPLTFYNINDVYDNNTININTAGTNVLLTISYGLYQTIPILCSYIQTLIQTERSTLMCSQNIHTGIVSIYDSSSTPTAFSLNWTPLLGMIGYTTVQTLTGLTSYSSLNIPSLIYGSYFYLKIGNLSISNHLINNQQTNNISFILQYGDLSNYTIGQIIELTSISSDDWTFDIDKQNINNLNIQLYDQFDNPVNLNGSDWTAKLKLYCSD